jgi:hypothetical protein
MAITSAATRANPSHGHPTHANPRHGRPIPTRVYRTSRCRRSEGRSRSGKGRLVDSKYNRTREVRSNRSLGTRTIPKLKRDLTPQRASARLQAELILVDASGLSDCLPYSKVQDWPAIATTGKPRQSHMLFWS